MSGFLVGLTDDLRTRSGAPSFGTEPLKRLGDLPWEWIADGPDDAVPPEAGAMFDAICVNARRVTAESVSHPNCRLRIIARHGVGYDSVDVAAVTAAGILLTNTPEAVRRPVATIAMTYILALSHKLLIKDRLTRAGQWNERAEHMGLGLKGKVLGLIGAGGVGRETIPLAKAFDMDVRVFDPYVDSEQIGSLGATSMSLDELARTADFLVVVCPLTAETHHLISSAVLHLMKSSAYLINVARGPIVDEAALIDVLWNGRIAGAGLDVFEQEPVDPSNPLLKLDNTIVSPHALCWTDENFGAIATSALADIATVLAGRRPRFLVNPEVLSDPRVKSWLRL